jgi:AcrR family transcriptional regulator
LSDDHSSSRASHVIRRRDEYAQATRQAIIEAARQLFSKHGYFSTKVDDIATLARVAPATVYAVSGGKHGLLRTLTEIWTNAPIVAGTINSIEVTANPETILCVVAAACRQMREEFNDIIRVLLATAPNDRTVAESFASATARYRQAFRPIAQRLSDLDALRDGVDVTQAIDVFWFYFGYSAFSTLHDDNGWSYERAEQWLCEAASRTLLHSKEEVAGSKESAVSSK